MNTILLVLAAAAAVCGVVGGYRQDLRILGVGVFLIAMVLILPVTV